MTELAGNIGTERFWSSLDAMVAESTVMIDRPRGTAHPRFPDFVYPLDYGYLEGTQSPDGGGIDVWRGSLASPTVTAVICTIDRLQRDSEIKILIGCTAQEVQTALDCHNGKHQSGILIRRPG